MLKAEPGQDSCRRGAADAGPANHDDVAVFVFVQLLRS